MLSALREAGLEDSTLIVFTSDHGDMDSAHKLEHKQVLYEESVRVPFIMSYRGVIPQGIVDDKHRQLLRGWVEKTGDRIATDYVNVKS